MEGLRDYSFMSRHCWELGWSVVFSMRVMTTGITRRQGHLRSCESDLSLSPVYYSSGPREVAATLVTMASVFPSAVIFSASGQQAVVKRHSQDVSWAFPP